MLEQRLSIGHEVLLLEGDLGANQSHHLILDDLISQAIDGIRKQVGIDEKHTEQEAVAILQTMDMVFSDNGFKDEGTNVLFHQGLGNRIVNCVAPSLIRLDIAERMGLPLVPVTAPESHLFTRWVFNDGTYFNWEPLGGGKKNDDYYVKKYNIHPSSICNGVFLRNVTRNEVLAIAYNQIGIAWIQSGQIGKALASFGEAIQLKSNFPEAYNNYGIALLMQNDHGGAVTYFIRAIEFNQNYHQAYTNRGMVYSSQGKHGLALSDFNKAIALNPNYVPAIRNREKIPGRV